MAMNRNQHLRSLEAEQAYNAIQLKAIAGATALRQLNIAGVSFPRGSYLPGEIVKAIAPRNLRALVLNHFVQLLSSPPEPAAQPKEKSNVRSRAGSRRRKGTKKRRLVLEGGTVRSFEEVQQSPEASE
jgi:hypothetical protein